MSNTCAQIKEMPTCPVAIYEFTSQRVYIQSKSPNLLAKPQNTIKKSKLTKEKLPANVMRGKLLLF
ncbi:hypothetical protein D7Z54_00855 [Salibacterium salarium]|uniref:Uncharacterized protein n=1 Tax=Salibacterium salarium TaxID=284579 RepID=A0A428N9V6_9BACI|nr:hypothetical protein D7Z54_00855 [Salibacterium salarium]